MANETSEQPVSWMAIPRHTPILDRDGKEVGHVDAVLGDEERDIFHGLALNLAGPAGNVELLADRVERITTQRIHTDLAPDEAKTLPPLHPDHWFEFKGTTRLLKNVKWGKDK